MRSELGTRKNRIIVLIFHLLGGFAMTALYHNSEKRVKTKRCRFFATGYKKTRVVTYLYICPFRSMDILPIFPENAVSGKIGSL
jgi:hypothetical protein